ncbi:MAG TPA: beta-propeller fold lactonase family protein [Acidobacteriaceae bacterium]|nr:beta-propeller fold lactonase family protein [Acidobacteriaceae bacterium]
MLKQRRFSFLILVVCGLLLHVCSGEGPEPKKGGSMLLVANKGDRTLDLIDPHSGSRIASIPVEGVTGHEVTASPDGRTAYVPIYGNSGVGSPGTDGSTIAVVDLVSKKLIGKVDFKRGMRPHCPVFDSKRNVLYVTTELDDSVSIVDPHTLKVAGSIPTGQAESHMFALSHDGHRGYTANVGPGTVSVLDMDGRKTLAVIPIAHTTQRISVSPDDKLVFTSDQTSPHLAVIDTSTDKVTARVRLPALGYGTAPTLDGRWLVVAMPDANAVAVVDIAGLRVARTIPVCQSPQEVLMEPDDPSIAYVSCSASNNVGVLDLANWTMKTTIAAGKHADGLAWAKIP